MISASFERAKICGGRRGFSPALAICASEELALTSPHDLDAPFNFN